MMFFVILISLCEFGLFEDEIDDDYIREEDFLFVLFS